MQVQINSIYYGGVASLTYENWLNEYCLGDEELMEKYRSGGAGKAYTEDGWLRGYDSWSDRYRWTPEEAAEHQKQRENRFNKLFVSLLPEHKGQWFQFIVTKYQEKAFLEDIKRSNLEHLIKYSSPELAYNSNYPEDGPKLRLYLLQAE